MAKPIETLSIQLKFKDAGSQAVIEKLKGSLKRLELGASGARPRIMGLRKEILEQGRASKQSVANISAQATALRALRDEARIGGRAFNRLTEDIKKLDAQMGKSGKSTAGRAGARQATQIAGAVISGGIFGGPEGALGAAGGAAFGGVEGAFAGAAIGAQLGGIRQALAASADYAASIGKLKIALEGVAPSTEDFNSALATAAAATNDLNVPQRTAISGITRLTAAVVGAEGPVADAETTFRNVTAAIKATGGSSEDVQGAITAMVQVFSKGKVSAEELSGQLGERLPGAVTLFAKANKMTLPELQKNLKAGTVGLNELMNFIRQLGVEFGDTAQKIASSNDEAGARLTVAFDNMKLSVGNALKDTGAEFQNIFGRFINEITPQATKAAEKLAKALVPVAKNLDLILVSVAGLAAGAVLGAAVKGFIALKAAIVGVTSVSGLLMLSPLFGGALAVAGIVAGIYAITQAFRAQRTEVEQLAAASRNIPTAQLSPKDRAIQIAESKRILTGLKADRRRLVKAGKSEGGFDTTRIDAEIAAEQKRLKRLTAPIAKKPGEEFKYKPITPDGGGTAGTIKDITEAQAAAQIKAIQNRTRGIELTKEAIAQEAELARVAAEKLPPNKKSVELARIEQREASQLHRLEQEQLRTTTNVSKAKLELNQLLTKAKGEQGLLNDEQLQQELNQIRVNELMLKYNILVEEGVISAEELKKKLEEAVAALNEAESPMQKFQKGLKEIFEEAINLKDALAVRGVQAVQEFGDAFADFVATGKASFKELTVSILQDLARIFARAALFKTLSLIPGVGSFLGFKDGGVVKGMTPPTTMPDSVSLMAANGMAFAKNKIVPYAKGGIVSKPTLFQYASGGTGRFGLMGEAGAEAIMPLRRGADGKLGVEANGGAASNVVVNVDASGTQVQGNNNQAKQLGSAISAAVQAELIKQRRPGGLLAG